MSDPLHEQPSLKTLNDTSAPPAVSSADATDHEADQTRLQTGPPPDMADPTLPQVSGYDLYSVLGKGGMGVVYKARHKVLGRLVALKMIRHADHADPEELQRFRTEGEAQARLQHPNIVQIYEVGNHHGLPYCALEFCPGGSLHIKLAGNPLPPKEAARLAEVLARAVAHAHQHGIVHRDLKPHNVLLTAEGEPKVTDFGLAKKLDADGQTQTGAVMGTPSYMAPEQAQGKAVGPQADIYALGALLYDLLTGRPPFKAATSVDTMLQVVAAEPVPPSELNAKVPRDLETICLKCLLKEPARRYGSALELAEDCAAFLEGQPIRARPIGKVEYGWRWCRRNPVLAAALALSVLSLLVGSVLALTFAFHAEAARRSEAERTESEARAKAEAEKARRDAQRQLVELCGASGLAAARDNDHALALLWFTRAVQLATDEPQQEELNRIRVANWLRQVWLPEGTFAVPGFRQNIDRIRAFQFSPDGQYLAVVASTGDCLVWDRRRGQLVTLPEAAAKGTAAAWQPRGNLLAVADKTGRIHLLTAPDFRPGAEVPAEGTIAVVAFSRDGKRLAWGGTDGARVWDVQSQAYVTPLLPHGGTVTALSFSSTGELLATGDKDNKARVFRVSAASAEPLFPPVRHLGGDGVYSHTGPEVSCPRFAAGDQLLLTLERDQGAESLLAWRSASDGKLLSTTAEGAIFAVNGRGNLVASLGVTKGRLLDAAKRQVLAPIPASAPWMWNEHVIFSADEQTLVTCGHETRARFFSVGDRSGDTLVETYPPVYHPMMAVRVGLTDNSQHLATALWDGNVYLWRVPAGPPVAYLTPPSGTSVPMLSPDKKFVLPRGVSYRNGNQLETRVYDADTGTPAGPALGPGGIVLDAAFSPDGTLVATASSVGRTPAERNPLRFETDGKGGNVQIWDWKTGQRLAGPIPTPGEPRGLAFRPDGRMLAVVCADYRVLLVDPKTGAVKHQLDPGQRSRPQNANQWLSNGEARFSPDGRFLVTWEMSPHVHVWDPDRGELLHTLQHNERIGYVDFSPTDPTLLATNGWGSDARVWDLRTGKLLVPLKHPRWVAKVRFSPDGKELLSIADDGLLRSWDWQAGKLRDGWPFHSTGFRDFRFTADRRWLVTIAPDELQVIDWPTKSPVSPRWKSPPNSAVGLEIPAGDRRAIVGGFTPALVGYDLEAMRAPAADRIEDLVALAELAAGRRILSQGNVVPLNTTEWVERWEKLRKTPTAALQLPADAARKESQAWADLGQALHTQQDLPGAIDAYRKSLSLYGQDAVVWHKLGLALDAQLDRPAAIAAFKQALAIDPGNARAWNSLGVTLHYQGDLDAAIAAFRQASDCAPRDATFHSNLGIALYDKEDLDGALAAAQRAIECAPKYVRAHNSLGLALRAKGELEGAIAAFRQAIDCDPKFTPAQTNLGVTQRWQVLQKRLPDLLAGKAGAASPGEAVEIARLCLQRFHKHYALSLKLYKDAFAADAKLGYQRPHRYSAACAAVRLAAGEDVTVTPLEMWAAELRTEAREWLLMELDLTRAEIQSDKIATRKNGLDRLGQWKRDADLASVREEAALAQLPESERAAWRALWTEVEQLLNQTRK
jgi:WD40 repeat protein/tetratricopeptide (TPR) repeat protein